MTFWFYKMSSRMFFLFGFIKNWCDWGGNVHVQAKMLHFKLNFSVRVHKLSWFFCCFWGCVLYLCLKWKIWYEIFIRGHPSYVIFYLKSMISKNSQNEFEKGSIRYWWQKLLLKCFDLLMANICVDGDKIKVFCFESLCPDFC